MKKLVMLLLVLTMFAGSAFAGAIIGGGTAARTELEICNANVTAEAWKAGLVNPWGLSLLTPSGRAMQKAWNDFTAPKHQECLCTKGTPQQKAAYC